MKIKKVLVNLLERIKQEILIKRIIVNVFELKG
jgi:hypothetical protein